MRELMQPGARLRDEPSVPAVSEAVQGYQMVAAIEIAETGMCSRKAWLRSVDSQRMRPKRVMPEVPSNLIETPACASP